MSDGVSMELGGPWHSQIFLIFFLNYNYIFEIFKYFNFFLNYR